MTVSEACDIAREQFMQAMFSGGPWSEIDRQIARQSFTVGYMAAYEQHVKGEMAAFDSFCGSTQENDNG